jgi:hypothetical protein
VTIANVDFTGHPRPANDGLGALLASAPGEPLYVTERQADASAILEGGGVAATATALLASSADISGREVRILCDGTDEGRARARQVAGALRSARAVEVRQAGEGATVSSAIACGQTWDDLTPASSQPSTPAPATVAVIHGRELAEPLPPLVYLCEGIGLTAGSGAPHLFCGYGYAGKSLALQSLALALVTGRPAWGGFTVRQSRVVHADMEQGRRLTARRYQRLATAMGVRLEDVGDDLEVAVMPGITLAARDCDAWARLMTGRDLLIIDSLRAATAGQDENSSDIRSSLDMLGALSEKTGCRAAVIHHGRKPSQGAPGGGKYSLRGSGAIFDACDGVYTFGAEKDEPIAVEAEKAREHGELVEGFALVIADVEVAGDPKGGLRVQLHGKELVHERRAEKATAIRKESGKRAADAIRKALAARPGLATMDLRAAAGLDGDAYAAGKLALGDELEIREEQAGRGRRQAHYLRGSA